MTTQIATLTAVITADTTGLQSGLATAKQEVNGFAVNMGHLGQKADQFGNQMIMMTAPIAAVFGYGIKGAMDFEKSLAEISARTGVTGRDLKRVGDFALEMGRKTAFSSQDAMNGLLQLMTSGQSLEEAMATLKPVMDLAAASGEDLGMTADAVTDIMSQFGLSVEDAAKVADTLAQAAGASSADVASLAEGFANVGPVAAAFGMSTAETAAALAVLAENGIKGAEAGTALKSALLHMASPEGAATLKKYNIELFDMEGKARPLPEVIDNIKTAMEDMTDQEKVEFLRSLGGAYGMVALKALTGDTGISAMTRSMEKVPGAAETASRMLDTMTGDLDELGGSLQAAANEVFLPFIETTLRPMVQNLTDAANNVGKWAKENPDLAKSVTELGAGLLIAGPALKVVGMGLSTISTLVTAGGTLLTGMGLLADAVILPVLPFAAATAGILLGLKLIQDQAAATERALNAVTMNGANPAGAPIAGDFEIEKAPTTSTTTLHPSTTIQVEPSPNLDLLADLGYTPSSALEALAQGGLSPSEILLLVTALGLNPSASLQSLVDMGVLPSEVLEAAWQDGFPPSATLQQYLSEGLHASNYLAALLAEGLKVVVTVQGGVADSDTRPRGRPRARGGEVTEGVEYPVGEEGPELFVPDADGVILPNGSFGGGTINIGTVVVQGNDDPRKFFRKMQEIARLKHMQIGVPIGGV